MRGPNTLQDQNGNTAFPTIAQKLLHRRGWQLQRIETIGTLKRKFYWADPVDGKIYLQSQANMISHQRLGLVPLGSIL